MGWVWGGGLRRGRRRHRVQHQTSVCAAHIARQKEGGKDGQPGVITAARGGWRVTRHGVRYRTTRAYRRCNAGRYLDQRADTGDRRRSRLCCSGVGRKRRCSRQSLTGHPIGMRRQPGKYELHGAWYAQNPMSSDTFQPGRANLSPQQVSPSTAGEIDTTTKRTPAEHATNKQTSEKVSTCTTQDGSAWLCTEKCCSAVHLLQPPSPLVKA